MAKRKIKYTRTELKLQRDALKRFERYLPTLKLKQLDKGLRQLSEEGTIQVFRPVLGNEWILGAVGALQFDVTMHRLRHEYGADAVSEPVGFAAARWVTCDDRAAFEAFQRANQPNLAHDVEGNLAYLAASEWRLNHAMEQHPAVVFHKTRENC